MTWLLWLAACAGCLAIGHILGAGWPDLSARYVLAQEEIGRLTKRVEITEELRAEQELTIEKRRLLAISRMVFDRIANGEPLDPDEAADLAQRIVDEIGHSVTDEPALGPSFRAVISECADCTQRLADALSGYELGGTL